MNGADAILQTLAANGVEVCFANPGTSEMQLVAAFDREPRVRPVLCLFEGVVTGAADGYARIAGKPAATLLHLGAGLANGGASLHNARRANSPIVNIVGDHALNHRALDAPLTSDIAGLAGPVSVWVDTVEAPEAAAEVTARALVASQTGAGGPATVILPADCAWSPVETIGPVVTTPSRRRADDDRIQAVAQALAGAAKPVLLLGSGALSHAGLRAAGRLAAAGVRVLIDTFVARQPRGAGRFAPGRMQYFGEMALADLAGADLMILAATKAPVAFFAYPDAANILVPEGCAVETLATPDEDAVAALQALAEAVGAPALGPVAPLATSAEAPAGLLNAASVGACLARHMPDEAIVSDDAITSSAPVYVATANAPAHDWLFLTGGAIGQGLPVAVGAAIAAPTRKVICLTGDGSAAYTVQGLWTMVREKLDVVVVVFANRAYRILDIEFARTRSGEAGPKAHSLLDIGDPDMDWVAMATAFGMSAHRCETAEDFDATLAQCMGRSGPVLIEAVIA